MHNSVVEELWRIFSFYALHADSAQPEVWRTAVFLRFAKECQIMSKTLPSSAVELEIGKYAKTKSKAGNEFNAAIVLSFSDFLKLLEIFATKVYPKDSADNASKRLLLENILLLANRRVPSTAKYNLTDEEACKLISETYGKCIQNIYSHYLDMATKRRNQLIAAEKIKHRDYLNDLIQNPTSAVVTQAVVAKHNALLTTLRDIMTEQRDLIGYKEYIQFCQDYSLKSTALLTAIQVGEVFLNLVPLNLNSLTESGMNFELFKMAVLYMALIAYEQCDAKLKPVNKVKALLLFMWKAVNNSEKTMQMVRNDRTNKLSSHAGSLNLFGSGAFSDLFLATWIKDGFPDYTDVAPADGRSDISILRNVSDDLANASSLRPVEGAEGEGAEEEAAAEQLSMISLTSTAKKSGGAKDLLGSLNLSNLSLSPAPGDNEEEVVSAIFQGREGDGDEEEDGIDGDDNEDGNGAPEDTGSGSTSAKKATKAKARKRTNAARLLRPSASTTLTLRGGDIAKLLQRKPELAEFLDLQIREMNAANTAKE